MTSPEIKILLVLASVSIVYAFVCEIRLSRKASRMASWLQKERPGLWSELNVVARNWNGGYPALKILHRRNVVGLPRFDREYMQLRAIERKLFWGRNWHGVLWCTYCRFHFSGLALVKLWGVVKGAGYIISNIHKCIQPHSYFKTSHLPVCQPVCRVSGC